MPAQGVDEVRAKQVAGSFSGNDADDRRRTDHRVSG
jgi:hypothetical protein